MRLFNNSLYLLIFLISTSVYSTPQFSQSHYLNECTKREKETAKLEFYKDKCGVEFIDQARETMTADTEYCSKLFPEQMQIERQKGLTRAMRSLDVSGKKTTCESFFQEYSHLIK